MKKIFIYILLCLAINTLLMDMPAFAAPPAPPAGRVYQPPTIDKPATLPGPSAKDQIAANEASKNSQDGTTPLVTMLTQNLIPRITTGLIGFVGVTAFVMLIVSGVRFVTAYGNDEAVGKAKTEAIYAVVGLVLSLLAYTIVTIVANLEITKIN